MARSAHAQIAATARHPNQAPECIQQTDLTTWVKHAAFLYSRPSRPPSQSVLPLRPRTRATPEQFQVRCSRQTSDIPSGLIGVPPWPPLARLLRGETKPSPGSKPGTLNSAESLPQQPCRKAADILLLAQQGLKGARRSNYW